MKTAGCRECSLSRMALSVTPNERARRPGGTSLTSASCTDSHNVNLAHLVSLGQLKKGEKVPVTSWRCFLFRKTGLGLHRDWTAANRAYVADCSFVCNVLS